jgi:hypothetical protein
MKSDNWIAGYDWAIPTDRISSIKKLAAQIFDEEFQYKTEPRLKEVRGDVWYDEFYGEWRGGAINYINDGVQCIYCKVKQKTSGIAHSQECKYWMVEQLKKLIEEL